MYQIFQYFLDVHVNAIDLKFFLWYHCQFFAVNHVMLIIFPNVDSNAIFESRFEKQEKKTVLFCKLNKRKVFSVIFHVIQLLTCLFSKYNTVHFSIRWFMVIILNFNQKKTAIDQSMVKYPCDSLTLCKHLIKNNSNSI